MGWWCWSDLESEEQEERLHTEVASVNVVPQEQIIAVWYVSPNLKNVIVCGDSVMWCGVMRCVSVMWCGVAWCGAVWCSVVWWRGVVP